MKKLFYLLLFIFSFVSLTAQSTQISDASEKYYERYFESWMQMDFRNSVLAKLDLTEEQIAAIDPVLANYMNERLELADKKVKLIKAYEAEMKEDDSRSDEREETSDFIVKYWESAIDEMKLKKNYFDLFENRISYEKAIKFFLIEDDLQYQIFRPLILRMAPVSITMNMWDVNKQKSYDDINKDKK